MVAEESDHGESIQLKRFRTLFYSVHCDICRTMGGNLRNFVQIYQKDAPAKCNVQGFPPGEYNDLSLRVCLPTKNELLPFLDQVKANFKSLNLFLECESCSTTLGLVCFKSCSLGSELIS
jgi:hypothetical protein